MQPLLHAIWEGDVRAVKAALKAGASPDAADADSTALCHAAFDGAVPVVRALLRAGADPNLADARGLLPLAVAASKDHAALIKPLVDAGARVEATGAQGGTALHTAAASGATKALKKLLAAGASVDAIDVHGAPPMHYAAIHGHDACLKALLAAGSAVDMTDASGRTALLHALDGMHGHRVKEWTGSGMLGAQPVTFRIRDGEFLCEDASGYAHRPPVAAERNLARAMNPRHATYVGCRDCATRLIKAEASITACGPGGKTALHELAALGEGGLLNKLLKGGADPNATDASGRSVAHHLAACRRLSAVEQKWVKASVDFTRVDAEGNHALHVAAGNGPYELVERLYYDHFHGDDKQARLLDTNHAGLTAAQCGNDDTQIHAFLDLRSDLAAKALRRVRGWPLEVVTARLESGTHFFAVFEGFAPYRTDHQFVRVLSAEHLVEAFVHTRTGDLCDVKVQPRSAWDNEAEAHTTSGSLQIQLLPIGDLPEGTREKMLACAGGADARLGQLRAGTHACMTDSGWGFLYDAGEGWLSVIVTDGGLTEITPMQEERALSDVNAPGSHMVSVEPHLRSEVAARIERAHAVGARYEAGVERLVTRAWQDEIDGYVFIGGEHAFVRSKGGRVRDARLVGIAHRVPASVWGQNVTWDAVDLAGPLALTAALRAGDVAAVHAAVVDGRLDLVVNGPDGTVRIKQDAPKTADWVSTQLADGYASLMVFHDVAAAPASDAALIGAMRAASPAAIAQAVGRSGAKRRWRMPGLEISLYGYSLIWFDGSDHVQPMIDYLDHGAPRDVPTEVANEIREALLLVARAL